MDGAKRWPFPVCSRTAATEVSAEGRVPNVTMQQIRDLATASHTDGQNLNELANATVVDDVKVLSQFPELVAFLKGSGEATEDGGQRSQRGFRRREVTRREDG